MEEDADYRVGFSSLYSIHDHLGFQGTIKNSPSDFIVIEIDEQGQLVNKAMDEYFLEVSKILPEPKNIAKKPKLDFQTGTFDARSNQEVTGLARFSSGEPNLQSDSRKEDSTSDGTTSTWEEGKADLLSSFLDEKTNEQLSQFALEIKEQWNLKRESVEASPELSLGRFLEKNQRAALHSVVRQTFPFLITVGKNSEIVVKPNLDYKELCCLVSEEEALDFFKYLDAKKENSKFTFKPNTNKDHRKAVHHFVNKKFGNLVETKSFPEENCKSGNNRNVITVRFREKVHRSEKRALLQGQERKVVYTAFTLRKENLEMFEALGFLAMKLGVIPSDFSYAGLKDKKAVTYQSMVVKKVNPERLKSVEKEMEKKRMSVFNIRPVNDPLRLGQLKGNHFDIIIRNLQNQTNDSANLRERILEAIENVKHKGFVNYYGPQRFGKGRKVHTDQIGLALLKSEMMKAVRLFLTPEDLDDPVNKAKKYFLQTEDAKGTLSMMPEFKFRERALLESLHRFGMTEEGCTRAWLSFPHSMRIFYVHAYSSKIWNEAASYRLAIYGCRVVEGDLVCLEEDVNDHFSSSKVVLPVLGYNILYPKNKVGQWYQEVLSHNGLQACRFKVPTLKLNVPGCYRQVLKRPHNLTHQLQGDGDAAVEIEADASLALAFDLDASCYATVCLREIMKHDV
ncbi:pseudouridylate synthase 7 homolog-like protein isoform X2 [Perognathus longimembris pacificus]|uniref:pseudouridylate synthase 7 homolog-like protein isoform X2 n=1 Tax=Perognathus longimembris pacificus TaxID=214514 RepID=UPI002019B393|nr:pseudouridylate synthase 7 homolog-like protein isoform X2 [Perognathus longimembris pacificus]